MVVIGGQGWWLEETEKNPDAYRSVSRDGGNDWIAGISRPIMFESGQDEMEIAEI